MTMTAVKRGMDTRERNFSISGGTKKRGSQMSADKVESSTSINREHSGAFKRKEKKKSPGIPKEEIVAVTRLHGGDAAEVRPGAKEGPSWGEKPGTKESFRYWGEGRFAQPARREQ